MMEELLNILVEKYRHLTLNGRVANYIPELSKMNPASLAIVVADVDGNVWSAGDYKMRFTLQSASKPFALALALMDNGADVVFDRIGMEPTGDSFNSLMKLETFTSLKPVNPLVNAGAIATTSLINGDSAEQKLDRLLDLIKQLAPGCDIGFNNDVYISEKQTGDRNRAIAYFLRDIKAISGVVEENLDLYFRQCSIEVDCQTLATMARTIAMDCGDDNNPVPRNYRRIIRTFMFTCGMYNASGEFAINVGFPAKSGVSGTILGVVPNRYGIGVFGPSLDHKGNSVAGVAMLTELSRELDLYLL